MAYIDYDFYARAYRLEGRALKEGEVRRLLWDAETFTKGELLATFEKFGIPCVASTPKRLLWEFLGECLRVAPTFGADGKILAPRVAYRCADKTFYVSRIPLVRLDGDRAAPGPRFRANSVSAPVGRPPKAVSPRFRANSVSAPVGRDGSAQHRKKAANDENDA